MGKWTEYAKRNKWLLVILAVGAVLRFYRIDYQSPWLDEIHSLNEADPANTLGQLYGWVLKGEQMPPLYFYCIYFLFNIFGHKVIVLRMFSAVLGVASIYWIHKLGKEIHSRRAGLAAAAMLCVNYFHLYYSQEGRPYTMLLLFAVISFYCLVRLLKETTTKNAVIYGVTCALMLYGHFVGMFTLFAQYLILLLFLIISEKGKKTRFFGLSSLSVVVMLICYLPALKALLGLTQVTGFWIPNPGNDSLTMIFKDFFGQSELTLVMAGFIGIIYFAGLSRKPDEKFRYDAVLQNKSILSFIVLSFWIVFSVLPMLIKSYVSISIVFNRYFIAVLPAVMLVLAIGICEVKNKVVRVSVISSFVLLSLTSIIIGKTYYSMITKTQFREVTDFIKRNNQNRELVVTSLGWYYTYFFKEEPKPEIKGISLEEFTNTMMQDSTNMKSFWYTDGHQLPYTLSKEKEDFLSRHFTIEENIDMYDCWARHYVLGLKSPGMLDISKFKNLQESNGTHFSRYIEKFDFSNNIVQVTGWTYLNHHSAAESDYEVVLIRGHVAYKLKVMRVNRPDNTMYFKKSYDIGNSGFNATLDMSSLPPGKYRLGIYMINRDTNEEGLEIIDRTIDKP